MNRASALATDGIFQLRSVSRSDGMGRAAMPLAFDHPETLGVAVKRIRGKLSYSPIGFQLLPDLVTTTLRAARDAVIGRPMP